MPTQCKWRHGVAVTALFSCGVPSLCSIFLRTFTVICHCALTLCPIQLWLIDFIECVAREIRRCCRGGGTSALAASSTYTPSNASAWPARRVDGLTLLAPGLYGSPSAVDAPHNITAATLLVGGQQRPS